MSKVKEMTLRKAAGCVIIKNNSILLLHRVDKDWWEVPGGKGEQGETLEQTAARELKEELLCEVRIIQKLGSTFFKAVKLISTIRGFLQKLKMGKLLK